MLWKQKKTVRNYSRGKCSSRSAAVDGVTAVAEVALVLSEMPVPQNTNGQNTNQHAIRNAEPGKLGSQSRLYWNGPEPQGNSAGESYRYYQTAAHVSHHVR